MNDRAKNAAVGPLQAELEPRLHPRLLLLIISFGTHSEFFIYTPSITRFRRVYLEEDIITAHLATIALDGAFGVLPMPKWRSGPA